jgi:hypothetical protein
MYAYLPPIAANSEVDIPLGPERSGLSLSLAPQGATATVTVTGHGPDGWGTPVTVTLLVDGPGWTHPLPGADAVDKIRVRSTGALLACVVADGSG